MALLIRTYRLGYMGEEVRPGIYCNQFYDPFSGYFTDLIDDSMESGHFVRINLQIISDEQLIYEGDVQPDLLDGDYFGGFEDRNFANVLWANRTKDLEVKVELYAEPVTIE
jgi:hypothetical protein